MIFVPLSQLAKNYSPRNFAVGLLIQRKYAIYQYKCTKSGKGLKIGTKEADTIKIQRRAHFERLNILETFQDSYSVWRDLTIKSKFLRNIFAVLLIHNINPTVCWKSSKSWLKMTHGSSGLGRSSLSYGIFNFTRISNRCWQSAVLAYFPGQISQQRFVQSIWFQVLD